MSLILSIVSDGVEQGLQDYKQDMQRHWVYELASFWEPQLDFTGRHLVYEAGLEDVVSHV